MSKLVDNTNKKFGKLVAIRPTEKRNRGSVVWECKCECGNSAFVSSYNLLKGYTKSCGCIRVSLLKSGLIRRTHGKRNLSLYWVWTTMKQRCLNPKNPKYKRYGMRGISISKDWMNFENFYNDMHKLYIKGLQIDRINNDGNYCKENCRWVTSKVNNNNKSNKKII